MLGILEALGYSVMGLGVVFLMLIAIMIVMVVLPRILGQAKKEEVKATPVAAAPVAPAPVPAAPAAPKKVPAPGSFGDIKLYNVSDKTAAMVMAIVADEMKAELNMLRFISIKEIG